jgi:RNA polymerase sigma factor (sigma-70 family)
MNDQRTLLAQYVENGSEQAFRELVTRYVDLVYSSAVRLVGGDTHLAQDVVQIVFADFARLSGTFSKDVMLGGWLHRRTCHVATTVMRGNRRRQHRERQAVEMNALHENPDAGSGQIASVLDEAINQLNGQDRTAIVLRFFEQCDLRSVGGALGSSEDAAQKRVARALEKLRGLLARRGVALSVAGLATILTAEAVTAAPIGLAASVSTAALATSAAGGGLTLIFLKLMAMSKLKIAVSTVVVAGLGTAVVIEHQAQTKLRDENAVLRQQTDQVAALQGENERLSNLLAQANGNQLSKEQLSELLRLRGEIGSLRRQTNDLGKLRAENQQLRSSLATANNAARSRPSGQPATTLESMPKESWAFVGYADPESAFQSTAWAMSQGDAKTLLASLAPETEELKNWQGKSEPEIAAKAKAEMEKVTGFKIVNKEAISDDEVVLTIYADGIGESARFKLQRIGNEWKFAGPKKGQTQK